LTVDLAIKNGKVVMPDGVYEVGLAVDEGKIVCTGKASRIPKADHTIDATGKIVLPGVIDAHVHLREPGTPQREDFETGTKAAAAGGVTTVLEMPVSTPAVATVEALNRRIDILKNRAVVDYGLYAGAGTHNIDQILGLAKAGAMAFKTFITHPPPEREGEYRGVYAVDDGSLLEIFRTVSQTRLPSCVHAENNAIIEHEVAKLRGAGRLDPIAHAESRPNVVEAEAIQRAITLAKAAKVRLHLCHTSTREAMDTIRLAKQNGLKVTAETCPQYLTLTTEVMKKAGPYAKINPPLRSSTDVNAMWNAVKDGTVDIIGSDHAPFPKDEKDVGWTDIWRAPAGMPQLETMVPLLLTKVNEGRITIERLVQVMSENPAKIFGLYPRKGAIRIGSDADFTIADLKKRKTIRKEEMHTKGRSVTVYDGWEVKGVPTATIVRGQIVMDESGVVGKVGYGQFLTHPRV